MDYRKHLYHYPDIYDHKNTDRMFLLAVRQNLTYHRRNNEEYRKILDRAGFLISSLRTMDDLHRIPVIPTMFFKSHDLWSMDPDRLPVHATSSGTSGSKSHMGFDGKSLWYALQMTLKTARRHGLLSPAPTNYVILGYEPHEGNDTVISKTQKASSYMAPALHRTYGFRYKALTPDTGEYRPDFQGVTAALKEYAGQPFPVRIIGFPFFLYFLLRRLEKRGIAFRLPPGSMVLLGGGWKQFYKEKAEKEELYGLIRRVLGIPEERCREFFGAVEHPAMYCDCPEHHFHVPIYSRVLIRDVETLEPVGFDRPGILNLITPLTESMPLTSVMTDDLAVLHRGGECGCGIQTPYFEILGRAGLEEIRTCAAGAGELLNGGGSFHE